MFGHELGEKEHGWGNEIFLGSRVTQKMIFLQLFFLRHHLIEKFTRNLFKWHLDTRFTPIHH